MREADQIEDVISCAISCAISCGSRHRDTRETSGEMGNPGEVSGDPGEIPGRSCGGDESARRRVVDRYVSVLREIVSLCAACSEVDAMRRGVMPARYYPTCRRSGCLRRPGSAGRCDVARGPPSAVPRARNRSTQPLPGRYRSSYLYIYIYVIHVGTSTAWALARLALHACTGTSLRSDRHFRRWFWPELERRGRDAPLALPLGADTPRRTTLHFFPVVRRAG